ncbi:MAG: DsrE family protein [Saprospiraceae bacterium]|nr:DsrE family protein [Saprospiraceae bacterium]MBK8296808.1 DsrE family protein [Saprospiraceae bacterium]
MKNAVLFSCLLLLCGNILKAQSAPYNVVFDVTSKDTIVHQMVIRWIKEITNMSPDANIEVVFYAKSMDMITTGNSVVSNDVIKFAAKKNVTFKVCEVALKNNALDKSQLLPGVQTVPDGIYEIISRQHEGWGYIKAAR